MHTIHDLKLSFDPEYGDIEGQVWLLNDYMMRHFDVEVDFDPDFRCDHDDRWSIQGSVSFDFGYDPAVQQQMKNASPDAVRAWVIEKLVSYQGVSEYKPRVFGWG